MKKKYRNLKLIIEAPTQEAWDSIIKHFGIEWSTRNEWETHKHSSAINIDEKNSGRYSFLEFYKNYFPYNNHTFLTYEQFKEQYLNKMSGKKKWNSLSEGAKNAFLALMDEMEKEDGEKEGAKEMTLETVINTVKDFPRFDNRLLAYNRLLKCQHWANDGQEPTLFFWDIRYFYESKKYEVGVENTLLAKHNWMFISREAAEKFLDIKEVPELLDIFYGRK